MSPLHWGFRQAPHFASDVAIFLRVDLGAFWVRLAPVQQLVDEPAVVIGLGILIDAATYVAGGGGASLLCQCGLPLAHAARCLGAERELRRQGFFGLLALGLLLRAGRTWLRWPQICTRAASTTVPGS